MADLQQARERKPNGGVRFGLDELGMRVLALGRRRGQPRATNDLAAAVAAGLLEPKGGGRSRHYVAASSICGLIAAALGIDPVEHTTRESIVAFLSCALVEPSAS